MVDLGLNGKVAIITGASQGIGEAIAVAFAQAGARVVVSSRKLEGAAKVAQDIESVGGEAIAIQAHMGYPDQVKSMVAQTLEKWGRVDIAVNNAGTNPHFGPVLTADEGQVEKILDVNLKGYFRLAQMVVPHMKEQGVGKIINVVSVAGLRPPLKMGVYGISKAGDIMLTQVLARELGQYNIQVNAIAPGIVQTKFSRALWEDTELMARHKANVPLRRVGRPEDVAGAALYLASSAADWVTGTVLVVDGGATLVSMVWPKGGNMSTTQVGSHIVYYDEFGAGHPLIFMSGLASTRLGWWKQIELFSRKFRVINIDNRDAGDSGLGSGPYTIADMAEDVAGVIANLNLGRAHIVGISMGGMIAQELAIRRPDLVDKLVLVSTTAGGPAGVNAKPEIAALLMRNEGEDIETRVRRTFTAIAGEGYMANHPEDLDQIVKNSIAKPMSLESYQRQLGACTVHFSKGTTERLAQITAPTLVVHGDYDPLIPYPNGKYLAEHIKGARLATYPGVGHLSPIEASERFNREVIAFLE